MELFVYFIWPGIDGGCDVGGFVGVRCSGGIGAAAALWHQLTACPRSRGVCCGLAVLQTDAEPEDLSGRGAEMPVTAESR